LTTAAVPPPLKSPRRSHQKILNHHLQLQHQHLLRLHRSGAVTEIPEREEMTEISIVHLTDEEETITVVGTGRHFPRRIGVIEIISDVLALALLLRTVTDVAIHRLDAHLRRLSGPGGMMVAMTAAVEALEVVMDTEIEGLDMIIKVVGMIGVVMGMIGLMVDTWVVVAIKAAHMILIRVVVVIMITWGALKKKALCLISSSFKSLRMIFYHQRLSADIKNTNQSTYQLRNERILVHIRMKNG
jgi:hypothetical protein